MQYISLLIRSVRDAACLWRENTNVFANIADRLFHGVGFQKQFFEHNEHKKFDYNFSFTKKVILNYWEYAKSDFSVVRISKSKFIACMEDMNAGRSDADHYDAEDLSSTPNDWDIDLDTIQSFQSAFSTLSRFFESQGL